MKRMGLFLGLLGMSLIGFSTPAKADYCEYSCEYPCDYCSCDGKFTFEADWLYWKLKHTNETFASVRDFSSSNDNLTETISSKNITLDPKFNNGFRVGAGYISPCNCWELNISYYYVPSDARKGIVIDPDNQQLVISTFVDSQALNSVRMKQNSTLQNVDVDIARTITFGECFKLRPHIGFRSTWMDTHFRAEGVGEIFDEFDFTYATKITDKFKGYGVEGGLWAAWEIGAGFSIVGHFGGSILYTKRHLDGIATQIIDFETELFTTIFEESSPSHRGTASLDYFLGLEYCTNFCDMELSAHIGWEQHKYFEMDLAYTQGLTLGVGVAF